MHRTILRLRKRTLLSFMVAWLTSSSIHAQWVRESYPLSVGWSGIWLSQDCSHTDISTLLSSYPQIQEVWQWNPLGSTAQFSQSPWLPLQADTAWKVWHRNSPENSTLGHMSGNIAYLVRVSEGSAPFNLELTGKPLLPRYEFSTLGSNFVGFPMQEPSSAAERSFEKFFSYSEVFKSNPPVFTYRNGTLSAQYPVQTLPRTTSVQRGKAYWIKNDTYADYYGPVKVSMLGTGLHFGATGNILSLRLKNVIDPAKNLPVTVTLSPAASSEAPEGQPASAGAVPLQVRGMLDPLSLNFAYESIPAEGISRTLAPGEESELLIAIDRSLMGGSPGAVFQSLLNITDSFNQSKIVLPVTAETTSYEGLWAGAAVVSTVDQVIGQSIEADAAAPSQFTIRLLVHRTGNGTTTLLQQVYQGSRDGVAIAGTDEAAVTAASSTSLTRISSASFPLSMAVAGTGSLQKDGLVRFAVDLAHNASTNPFVHTYHPDHDNLDARFEQSLPAGVESYAVSRGVALDFDSSLPGVSDPGWGSTLLGGHYSETLTGLRTTPLRVTGQFMLQRISDAPVLTH
ncbi:hypothetical protein ACFQY0_05970 [Haloferula chungangensis]|uniref:Uncharacterized protein n=1 Tax=Haloferula chungangensis TaxID=1048331 RepID=A0ABW2L542_9BACT